MTTENLRIERFAGGRFGDGRALAVWAALVVATIASYLVGTDHGVDDSETSAALVIGVALVKVRLVAMHFMEIARAPVPLRVIFEVYCAALFVILIGLYLIG